MQQTLDINILQTLRTNTFSKKHQKHCLKIAGRWLNDFIKAI